MELEVQLKVKIVTKRSKVSLSKKTTFNAVSFTRQRTLLHTQSCAGGKIEKNEVGGACGAYGGGERCAQGSRGETRGKEVIGETQTQMGG